RDPRARSHLGFARPRAPWTDRQPSGSGQGWTRSATSGRHYGELLVSAVIAPLKAVPAALVASFRASGSRPAVSRVSPARSLTRRRLSGPERGEVKKATAAPAAAPPGTASTM